jgi:hypothetical protein
MEQVGEARIGAKGIQLYAMTGIERKFMLAVSFLQKRDTLVTIP